MALTVVPAATAAKETEPFPTRDVCRVWEWPILEEKQSGGVTDIFVTRYHRAQDGNAECGQFGISVISPEIPELGVLYVAWNISKDVNGQYSFESATYAHQADKGLWLIAPSGYIVTLAEGSQDIALAIVYRRLVKLDERSREYKIVGEYRVIYSTRTITHVILKIIDLDSVPERELHNFSIELAKTPVGNKEIKKKRIIR